MSAHSHREVVPGCYRCELNEDEARHALLDEAEQWARGHANRRSGELMAALVARVREAEAERDEGWRVAAEQTRLERARAERAEAVIAEANPAVVEVTDDMIARAEREYQWSGNIRKVLVAALGGGE